MTKWENWKTISKKHGLDPVEALLWYITFIAMVVSLIAVFALGMHWLWPTVFFVMLFIEAGVIGNKMEKEGSNSD
ncbi:membrane protein [Arthrobacter phage Zeina]|nr:membrane protein [Arthrobacter phage Zeina]